MGAEHSNVITPVFEGIQRFLKNTDRDPFIPRHLTYDKEKLESQLKNNEGFYRASDVTLTLEPDVEIDSFQMCSRYMRQYKFTQIGNLVEMYKKEGLDLFGPIAVELKDKKSFSGNSTGSRRTWFYTSRYRGPHSLSLLLSKWNKLNDVPRGKQRKCPVASRSGRDQIGQSSLAGVETRRTNEESAL
jgi:hypothetical protein